MIENTLDFPILSLLIAIPLAGAISLFFFPREEKDAIRIAALGFTLVNFIASLLLLFYFDTSTYKMQFVERFDWIPWIGVQYFLGMDGISLLLMLLITLTAVIAVLCSWTSVEERVKEFMIHILILETGMVGVFVALDMILFFLFWEIGLVPMFFLIGVWGGKRKLYANIKFFLYTLFGSVFMLAAIIALYFAHGKATGVYTFDLLKLYEVTYPYDLQWWVFLAFFLAFAIKVPVFPFHTWLPDAHVEAPTAGSVILAAILLKMGTYGFLRFNLPLTLQASYTFAPFIVLLAVVGIVYGAFLAMAQKDIKKLVAYSSVSHLGAVMAGIFAMNQQGIDGGVLQMINHGVSTGGLFLLIGIIYERRHTREIADFGGLAKVMPVYATFALIIFFSSIGLPGTNGFVGEILILIGLFKANVMMAAIGATGVILGAAYMLWMYQRVWFGKVTHSENAGLKDLSAREIVTLAPIVILIFWMGIFPGHFLKLTHASTAHLTEMIERNQAEMDAIDNGGHITMGMTLNGPSVVADPHTAAKAGAGADAHAAAPVHE